MIYRPQSNRTESTQQSEPKFLISENCLSNRDTQKQVMKNHQYEQLCHK